MRSFIALGASGASLLGLVIIATPVNAISPRDPFELSDCVYRDMDIPMAILRDAGHAGIMAGIRNYSTNIPMQEERVIHLVGDPGQGLGSILNNLSTFTIWEVGLPDFRGNVEYWGIRQRENLNEIKRRSIARAAYLWVGRTGRYVLTGTPAEKKNPAEPAFRCDGFVEYKHPFEFV